MSFQAYLDNIKTKTGNGPDDFKRLAVQKGFFQDGQIKAGIKAGEIVNWPKEDFELGHGYTMAIYALFKGVKNEGGNNLKVATCKTNLVLMEDSRVKMRKFWH